MCKVECTPQGSQRRFVVTNLSGQPAGTYRGFYCSYFRTRAGTVPTGGDNEFQKFFSTFGEGMDRFRRLGIDPLDEAVAYAHKIGIRLVASIRMDGPKPPPYDGSPGPFYDAHPEFRLIAPDGSPTLRLSLAYAEVRERYLAMFREALGYGVDGIAVIFTRNFPFVGHEAPVVESFRKKYGLDPRALRPPDDSRFQTVRTSMPTALAICSSVHSLSIRYSFSRRAKAAPSNASLSVFSCFIVSQYDIYVFLFPLA